jgi:hypothetical protein
MKLGKPLEMRRKTSDSERLHAGEGERPMQLDAYTWFVFGVLVPWCVVLVVGLVLYWTGYIEGNTLAIIHLPL